MTFIELFWGTYTFIRKQRADKDAGKIGEDEGNGLSPKRSYPWLIFGGNPHKKP